MATALAVIPMCLFIKDLSWQAMFFIVNVLLIGVCHGSLDHLRCPPDRDGRVGRLRLVAFGVAYIGLAALVLTVWLHDPGPMLVSFLSVSCIHFATDEDMSLPLAEKILWGFLPVLAPCFLHSRDVGELFSFLVGAQIEFSAALISVLRVTGFLALGLAISSLLVDICGGLEKNDKSALLRSLSGLLLILSNILLPPLLSFTIYFCWWHSLRQCIRQVAGFDATNFRHGLSAFIRQAAVVTLGSWLIALAIYLACSKAGLASQSAQQIRTLFYLLSALTVPHMFVSLISAIDQSHAESLHGQYITIGGDQRCD
jgi:Brp/Blh family beta-carotene 15,15'-monooxygenase